MVDFLERSQLLSSQYTQLMRASLLAGRGLPQLLADLGFSDQLVTQLALADQHGNTQQALLAMENYLNQLAQVRKKLLEVLTYPVILLLFLGLMMLGLKTYLLPQLEGENWAVVLIDQFPYLLASGLFLLLSWSVLGRQLVAGVPPIRFYSWLSRLPYLGKLVQLYLTAYYAREWGNLIGQGVELVQVVSLMQEQKSRLFRELGRELQQALLAGQSFQDNIKSYPFFKPELHLIIAYGDVKAGLGKELTIYAQECWQLFFSRLHQASQLIQPLVFIFVGLMIVMIYAAMLLPIYQNIPSQF